MGRHPVLIGLYSRDGWSHPGPLLYYTLALPYRLTGGNPAGLLVGALAVNGAAVGGMAAPLTALMKRAPEWRPWRFGRPVWLQPKSTVTIQYF